jgi:predicted extracellular nuclease
MFSYLKSAKLRVLLVSIFVFSGAVGTLMVQPVHSRQATAPEAMAVPVAPIEPAVSTTLVISQFQVAGGTTADEFVELHNVSALPVDLNGHNLAYRAASGTSDTTHLGTWTTTTIIPAGGYYLVAASPGYDGLVTPDATFGDGGSGRFAAAGAGIGLRSGPFDTGTIVDSDGYGTATNVYVEGAASAAPAANASRSRLSSGCGDTDNNSADFALSNPSAPRNSASPPVICSLPTATATLTAGPANTNTPVAPTSTNTAVVVASNTGPPSTPTTTSTPLPSTSTSTPVLPSATSTSTATIVPTTVSESGATNLVISQVYGGGSSTNATTYCFDFIELFNPTSAPITTNNWSVQYAAAAGPFSGVFNLPNVVIPAGRYFLIQSGTTTTGSCAALPTPDAIAALNLSATQGKVALVNNQSLLACGETGNRCTTNPSFSPFIVDFIGYGAASDFEGTGPVPALSLTTSAERNGQGCVDSDNNNADFTIMSGAAITPRNSQSPANFCTGGTATVTATFGATITPGGSTPTRTSTSAASTTAISSATSQASGTSTPLSATSTPGTTGTGLVISQVYGGGASTVSSTYCFDFIELFNPTQATITANGWSVQYAAATGNISGILNLPNLTIPAGGYYLIQTGTTTTGSCTALPTPDTTGALNISSSSGKVALVNNQNVLPCGAAGNQCTTNPNYNQFIVDFVGYGTSATDYEGAGPTGTLSTTTSAERNGQGCVDLNNNSTDFTIMSGAAITPRNSQSPTNLCVAGTPTPTRTPGGPTDTATSTRTRTQTATATPTGGPQIVKIGLVQGSSLTSSRVGQVLWIQGVVTGIKTNGFFMQDTGDGDPNTSDGIFVFTSSFPSQAVGANVIVRGTVAEFQASSRPCDLTVTEMTSPLVTANGQGTLPTPVAISNVPEDTIIYPNAVNYYERMEGMLVQVTQAVVIGPTNPSFGEFWMIAGGDAVPGSGYTGDGHIMVHPTAVAGLNVDYNPERILVDDESRIGGGNQGRIVGADGQSLVNVGDRISSVTGVLDYGFSNYRIQPSIDPEPAITHDPVPTPPVSVLRTPAFDEFRVVSFNMENYFDGLPNPNQTQTAVPAPEILTKTLKVTQAISVELRLPDIIIVQEIEDAGVLNGDVNGNVPGSNVRAVVPRLNDAGYPYTAVSRGSSDVRGIEVGFLYRTDRATLQSAYLATDRLPDPGGVWVAGREPLVGEFTTGGHNITMIGNHWKSKGGDDPLYGDPSCQPPTRGSETLRKSQAQYVRDYINNMETMTPTIKILVAGDLNDFYFPEPGEGRDPVTILKGDIMTDTSVLTNLIEFMPDASRWTYNFEGNSQVLDHILINPNLEISRRDQAVAHFDNEFHGGYTTDPGVPFALSDHDPPVGYFANAGAATSTPAPTSTASATATRTATVSATATATPQGMPTACTITFTDVEETNVFYPFIRCLACRGIISGYDDGTFRPFNDITRGQIAKIVSNAARFDEDPGPQIYEDVDGNNPFYQWINRLSMRGHMGGYLCGTVDAEPCIEPDNHPYFRPFNNATRGQLSKIVSNAAAVGGTPSGVFYTDVQEDHPFYTWIMRLTEAAVMSGYDCGGEGEPCDNENRPYFRPFNNVTRGQASKIVANTFFPGCQTPGR